MKAISLEEDPGRADIWKRNTKNLLEVTRFMLTSHNTGENVHWKLILSFLVSHFRSIFTEESNFERKEHHPHCKKVQLCYEGLCVASDTSCLESVQTLIRSNNYQVILEWNILPLVRRLSRRLWLLQQNNNPKYTCNSSTNNRWKVNNGWKVNTGPLLLILNQLNIVESSNLVAKWLQYTSLSLHASCLSLHQQLKAETRRIKNTISLNVSNSYKCYIQQH